MCPTSAIPASHSSRSEPPIIPEIVPKTSISHLAYKHVSSLLHPTILSHSVRVYLYASALAKHTGSIYASSASKHDLLFTACLFHDIGTTSTYNGPMRFEIEGADAAKAHLSRFDMSEEDKHDVWTAIACHTSPQIAERIGELSKLVRLAVITDFGKKNEAWDTLYPLRTEVEGSFGRGGIEKVLGDAVVEQAKGQPEKAPMVSWPGALFKASLEDPEWEGVNKAF